MLYCLLDHKAQEHFFEVIYTPIFQLRIELLMRNIEKIRQLLRVNNTSANYEKLKEG